MPQNDFIKQYYHFFFAVANEHGELQPLNGLANLDLTSYKPLIQESDEKTLAGSKLAFFFHNIDWPKKMLDIGNLETRGEETFQIFWNPLRRTILHSELDEYVGSSFIHGSLVHVFQLSHWSWGQCSRVLKCIECYTKGIYPQLENQELDPMEIASFCDTQNVKLTHPCFDFCEHLANFRNYSQQIVEFFEKSLEASDAKGRLFSFPRSGFRGNPSKDQENGWKRVITDQGICYASQPG
jgi:hypothetical protein